MAKKVEMVHVKRRGKPPRCEANPYTCCKCGCTKFKKIKPSEDTAGWTLWECAKCGRAWYYDGRPERWRSAEPSC